jgi:carboxymethylenebutenolidase
MTRTETVAVGDGEFPMHVWTPEGGSGPGVLLVQEIFGVSDYLREVAQDLAALGYVVGAPELFWRVQPGWAVEHTEENVKRSLEVASRFDGRQGVQDLAAALELLRGLPEVTGGMGVMGFCLGGTMAYLLATKGRLDAVVSFYGSGVPDAVGLINRIDAPLQFHFGGSDPYIPRDRVDVVEQAVRGRPNVEFHVQEEAGHAFHNRKAPMFYRPEPAARAWALTEAFLAKHLPV